MAAQDAHKASPVKVQVLVKFIDGKPGVQPSIAVENLNNAGDLLREYDGSYFCAAFSSCSISTS